MNESILSAAKSAACLNRNKSIGSDGTAPTFFNRDVANNVASVEPMFGLAILATTHDEHYPLLDGAADSMVSIAELLKIPLRLWHCAQSDGYFFAHASLDATLFGCDAVASHHPISA